jgi:hypothetical protein
MELNAKSKINIQKTKGNGAKNNGALRQEEKLKVES